MKKVTAIIRPARLEALRGTLRRLPGFPGMTVTSCGGITAPDRLGDAADPLTDFTPKVRVEVVAEDDDAMVIVEAIRKFATTGQIGDGIVWLVPVEAAWRI